MIEEMVKDFKQIKYDSLNEFYNYICDTPINETFRWEKHESVDGSKIFTKTESFEEAVELFKNGWSDMAGRLTQTLKVESQKENVGVTRRNIYDVVGYQASVPRYLQGVPNSMVRSVNVPVKSKVITLVKSIGYSFQVSADTIIDESVKALKIVKKLEAQGYKINLDIAVGSTTRDKKFIVRARIKKANERLNVSKLAFPLVHPSMLRRLYFRWVEVYPEVTRSFVHGYGKPIHADELKSVVGKNEYVLPAIITTDIENFKNVEDLTDII